MCRSFASAAYEFNIILVEELRGGDDWVIHNKLVLNASKANYITLSSYFKIKNNPKLNLKIKQSRIIAKLSLKSHVHLFYNEMGNDISVVTLETQDLNDCRITKLFI